MNEKAVWERLIELLYQAEQFIGNYSGGYSGEFLSAEEFRLALTESIRSLTQPDKAALNDLNIWFAPASSWDDFTGSDGMVLGNEIFNVLAILRSNV